MAYEFNFDLTKVSRSFFRELAKFSDHKGIHRKIGDFVKSVIDRFKIQRLTGLPLSDAVKVIDDLVDIYAKNLSHEEEFEKTANRALFLPHCSRKYMDQRCQAEFDPKLSTYKCQHCSEDCLINKASEIGEERGYDTYILPGGSCIPKILNGRNYEAVVGVACPHEIQLAMRHLEEIGLPYQSVPLLRNGCSNTEFNLETFEQTL
ncbi:hypothetical protein AKJ48_01795 [candidate division MSBL1 archaeon SCGC-AAA261O19]|uniref:DUF116 domain-containing protein n=2 Tax=candidate division MSBL1 TaxID=215777 RepID=A0A133UZZ0_9EURY|nr:hypothetical protein AKJ42_02575 [candidate division MSBL1 archaeon SCGC-AAA261C02]KXB04667.1 hypothetical protein AKJ48_01795 [candidate division MSBL1 archaeon SCGC-AAA261O19]